MTVTVLEIVKKYLEDRGFDGLYHKFGCCCLLEDLMICDGESWDIRQCQPGYQQLCNCGEHELHVGPEQQLEVKT